MNISITSFAYGACFLSVLFASACQKAPKGGPRMDTAALTGKVTVDGKPVDRVLVECHPEGDGAHGRVLSGHTDAMGIVTFSTYVAGDGVPPGNYKLTFKWLKSQREFGPQKDAFKGKYSDPSRTEFEVSAVAGIPNDFGLVELVTK